MRSTSRRAARRRITANAGSITVAGCVSLACLALAAGCRTTDSDDGTERRRPAGPRPDAAGGVDPGTGEIRFVTAPAMYSANEEWLTFACELPDGQVNIGSAKAVEMYWYSRFGLGNLLFRSGMGVHIVHNPLFRHHAENDVGMPWHGKPDGNAIFFEHKIAQFVARTAADRADARFPPKGVYPIFLEFSSGVPAFLTQPELDDFTTLRWDPEKMDRSMTPAGWGQAMMKQILWARDFFTDHKRTDGITYLGNDKDDGGNGFRGAALTAQAITKSFALKSTLAYHADTGRLGGVDPASYDPSAGAVYYPHRYEVRFASGKPPKPERFVVTDATSDLFDVASLLWAESEFYFFTDPEIEDDYDRLFGDPKWNPRADREQLKAWFRAGKTIFPAKPHELAMGLSAVNLKNLRALHFDPDHGTLVDAWHPRGGRGERASTHKLGMAMVALANTREHMHDAPPLREGAAKLLAAQGRFLVRHQADDGSMPDGFELGREVRADPSPRTLLAQSFAIRGLLAAHRVTGDARMLQAAERVHDFMERRLWSPEESVYRAALGARRWRYDGYNFGATLGALRELAIVKSGAERRAIVARLDSFFGRIGQRAGLQLSEIGPTGEPVPPLAKRARLKAEIRRLMASDPARAERMKAKMADSDGDGVPKPPFVRGTRFGAAPVQREFVELGGN